MTPARDVKVVELAERRGFLVVIDDSSPPESKPRAACWGEILRYGAFCRELGIPEDSDREAFVLAAYRKWGREFPSHLLGEVAYAVWDPSERTLIAFSDTAGSRPIYYASSGDRIAVSTDTRALRALPWVGSAVDDLTVVAWLVDGEQREDASFYANIKRLPGGFRLVARGGRVDANRWWGPFFPADGAIKTQEDFVARFRELLFDAVRDRLLLGGPVGHYLSGGYDSNAIAAVAAALAREPGIPSLHTVSATFPGLPCDESERIAIARASLPFTGDVAVCRPEAITPSILEGHVQQYDAPFVDEQHATNVAVTALAQSSGAVAMLGGWGGDELLYAPYRALDLVRDRGPLAAVGEYARLHGVSLGKALWWVGRTAVPHPTQVAIWRRRHGIAPSVALVEARWKDFVARSAYSQRRPQVGLRTHTAELRWWLSTLTDNQWRRAWMLQAEGPELRAPFFDRRLLELVQGTPMGLQPGETRDAFKPALVQATADLMQPSLTRRRWKVDFDPYNDATLRATAAGMGRMIEQRQPWASARYVSRARAAQLCASSLLTEGVKSRYVGKQLSRVLGVEVWLDALRGDGLREGATRG